MKAKQSWKNWERIMSEVRGAWMEHPVFGKMTDSIEIVRFLRHGGKTR